jgi:hypothetical protein
MVLDLPGLSYCGIVFVLPEGIVSRV